MGTNRETVLATTPCCIPAELKKARAWAAFRHEKDKDGTFHNVPYDAETGAHASSTNPNTWTTFQKALAATSKNGDVALAQQMGVHLGHYDGVSRALVEEDGLVYWDFDDCRDPYWGMVPPEVLEIIKALDTYTEVSPSETGLRAVAKGSIPRNRKHGNVEVYCRTKFMTITGHHLASTPRRIMERQAQIDEVYAKHFPPVPEADAVNVDVTGWADVDAAAARRKALHGLDLKDGGRLLGLLEEPEGYVRPGVSHSEVDWQAVHLMIRAGLSDAEIAALWHGSPLGVRDKVQQDKRGYVADTIARARAKVAPKAKTEADDDEVRCLPFRTATEIRRDPRPKPAVIIEGLLHMGEIGIETGPYDSLKSRFAAELARALVTGELFLDRFPVVKTGPVMLIQVEIHPGFYDDRIIDLTAALLEKHTDRLMVVSGTPFRLESPYLEQLEVTIQKHGVIAVLVDPAGRMWPRGEPFEENSNTDMERLFDALGAIRDRQTVAIILVHHDPKDETRRARGASALQNDPDVRIYLTGLECPDGKVRSRVTMRLRNFRRPKPFTVVCLDDGRLAIDDTPVATAVKTTEQNQVLLGMEELGDGRVTSAKVAEHIHKGTEATRNILNRLAEAGWLGKDNTCKPHEYWLLTEAERAANAQTPTPIYDAVRPFAVESNSEEEEQGESLP